MTPVMWWLMAAPASYLLGSVNPAAWIARVLGVDIRQVGSGNPGATNVGRALGPRWAVLVGAIDILKGFLPALIFGILVSGIVGGIAGWFDPSDVVFSVVLAGLVLWRHQRNIRAAAAAPF